jgi:hypothetical protein
VTSFSTTLVMFIGSGGSVAGSSSFAFVSLNSFAISLEEETAKKGMLYVSLKYSAIPSN